MVLPSGLSDTTFAHDDVDLRAQEELALATALTLRRATARRRILAAAARLGAAGERRTAAPFLAVHLTSGGTLTWGFKTSCATTSGLTARTVYNEEDFERRFRMPRDVLLRIFDAVKDQPSVWQRINATGRPQAHPMPKVVAVFRVIADGAAYDRADEYVRLSRSSIAVATKNLMSFIVRRFSPQYLRQPLEDKLRAIMKRNAERGLPGCIGSIDCSHWRWTSCPKGFQGMCQSGADKGNRSIVLEAACDEDLWIWHWYVGAPGSFNDVNVLHESPLYRTITSGQWPPHLSYTTNGRTRDLPYYLADGIYPRYAFFVTPYPQPVQTLQHRTFNRLQEALRKDVERLYSVITARFHIALNPARYRTVKQMTTTAKSIAILHNMIVEARRDGFAGRRRSAAAAYDAELDGSGAEHSTIACGGAAVDEAAPSAGPDPPLFPGADAGAGEPPDGAGAAVDEAAPAPLDSMASVDSDDSALGGSGGGGVEHLAALPHSLPYFEHADEAITGTLCQRLLAWARTTDTGEHLLLREDLSEHVWADRGDLVKPYLQG